MDKIFEILSTVVGVAGLLAGVVVLIVRLVELGKAKTSEEKAKVLKDIESDLLAYISMADATFSKVPKSGASKLEYVLNKVQQVCITCGVEFEKEKWTEKINNIVGKTNKAIDEVKAEQEKAEKLESLKSKVLTYVDNANAVFANIPDNLEYKMAYVLKYTEGLCNENGMTFDKNYWDGVIRSYMGV